MIIDIEEDSQVYNDKVNICWFHGPIATDIVYCVDQFLNIKTESNISYYRQRSYKYNTVANLIKPNIYIRKLQNHV